MLAQKQFGGGPRVSRWVRANGDGKSWTEAVHTPVQVRDDSTSEKVTLFVAGEIPFERLKGIVIAALGQTGDKSQFRVYGVEDSAQSYDEMAAEYPSPDKVSMAELGWLPEVCHTWLQCCGAPSCSA